MKVQRQKALAKINLTLDIVGKREDGYHELETIMHTVSLHDKVTLLPGEGGVGLWCNLPYVPRDSRNIAYKAALAFFQETGKKGRCTSNCKSASRWEPGWPGAAPMPPPCCVC